MLPKPAPRRPRRPSKLSAKTSRPNQAISTKSWELLDKEFGIQLGALEEGFTAANQHLNDKLTSMLTTRCDDNVYVEVMEKATQELEKLAVTLGQAMVDLRKLADRPRQLADSELSDLTKKLKKILAVLNLVESNIYQKARGNSLFDS